jgi:hypothetical protein
MLGTMLPAPTSGKHLVRVRTISPFPTQFRIVSPIDFRQSQSGIVPLSVIMDPSYSIRAHDGQIYGPYPLPEILTWIAEGRIGRDTPMTRSDLGTWQPAGNYAELRFPDPASVPGNPVPLPPVAPTDPASQSPPAPDLSVLKSGASWFYWIAGLTAVNAGASLAGSSVRFVVGTALVDVFNALGESANARGLAIVLNVLLIALFVICGIFAHKAHLWAFAVGISVYLIDTLLCLIAQEWIGLAFHAWAIFGLAQAMRLAWQLRPLLRGTR